MNGSETLTTVPSSRVTVPWMGPVSSEDVRRNLAHWESASETYQEENAPQLNRWDRLGWGTWDVLEDDVHALGDVRGSFALELGCGAAQFGLKVAMRGV